MAKIISKNPLVVECDNGEVIRIPRDLLSFIPHDSKGEEIELFLHSTKKFYMNVSVNKNEIVDALTELLCEKESYGNL